MKNIVIFDLDGTILNTIKDLTIAVNTLCKKNKYPRHSVKKVKKMVGNGIPKLVERAIPQGINNPRYTELLKDFIQIYKVQNGKKTKIYKNLDKTLKKLKAQNVILAVNTNKTETEAKTLCEKFFPNTFDIICGDTPNKNKKPSPDGVEKIWQFCIQNFPQKFNLQNVRQNSLYVGDSDVDFMTAKNAKIDFLGVEWGFKGEKFLKNIGVKNIAKKTSQIENYVL